MNKEDVAYVYMEYYSVIKKNKIMPLITTWMDLETITPGEVSQIKNDKHHTIHSYVESKFLKVIQMKLFTKEKQTYR